VATKLSGAEVGALVRHRRSVLAFLVGAKSQAEMRQALWGYAFLSPWLLGLIVFVSGPMIACLALSFTNYDILSSPQWIGLTNYLRAFMQDEQFWPSLSRTFYYSVLTVPLGIVGSLLLAILLNQGIRGTSHFRTMFFLPHLTPVVAMATLWVWMMNPEIGPLNYVLSRFGWPANFPWLTSPKTVIPSLALISLWSGVGGNNMLIFLAGLQGVPQELYEASEIDGAGRWSKFWYITLPMISPAMFFNLVLGIIGALQVFSLTWVATKGGPFYGSWFLALHIYQQAFSYFRMGYGAALAWIFAIIVMGLTFTNVRLSDRWVYYGGTV
jgi:multiple sugar transport system permease protein